MNTTKQLSAKSIKKTKAELRETKKKLKMKISGKSVFKLKNIITQKSASTRLTK